MKTTWHAMRTNPLDHLDKDMPGEGGAIVNVSQNMSGLFTVTVSGPVQRRFEGLGNMQACQVLSTWNAQA